MPMEALSFLKFWRPTNSISPAIDIPPPLDDDLDEDDDDSFFELELSPPCLDTKNSEPSKNPLPKLPSEMKQGTFERSPCDSPRTCLFSRRKIIPIEAQPAPRPQSPISLFKSSPKFRVSMFRKSKSMPNPKAGETEETEDPLFLNRAKSSPSPNMSNLSVISDAEIFCGSIGSPSDGSGSKRFTKDGMQRYMKLVKPFSVKGAERELEDLKLYSRNLLRASPASSPAMARKYEGKRKMLTAVNGGVSPSPARNDDSWAQHHDGIQSAILHCKKSFNSSRDCSLLSRSTNCVLQRELPVPATA